MIHPFIQVLNQKISPDRIPCRSCRTTLYKLRNVINFPSDSFLFLSKFHSKGPQQRTVSSWILHGTQSFSSEVYIENCHQSNPIFYRNASGRRFMHQLPQVQRLLILCSYDKPSCLTTKHWQIINTMRSSLHKTEETLCSASQTLFLLFYRRQSPCANGCGEQQKKLPTPYIQLWVLCQTPLLQCGNAILKLAARPLSSGNFIQFKDTQELTAHKQLCCGHSTLYKPSETKERKLNQSNEAPFLSGLILAEGITPRGVMKSLTNGFQFAHRS